MTRRPSDGEVLAVSGLAGHRCRGLALRHGDNGWRLSLSTAARKIAEGNGRMEMHYWQQLVCNEGELSNSCRDVTSLGYEAFGCFSDVPEKILC